MPGVTGIEVFVWPFRDKNGDEAGLSLESEAALNWSATRREFRPLVTAEEAKSFYFAQTRIVELASETDSQDPEFRDLFGFFAHKLREERPPGILGLIGVGEEKGRLFRVWERREFSSACASSLGDSIRSRELLATLLDGLLYLNGLFPVQVLHVPAFSIDRDGLFVARLPFTTRVPADATFPGDLIRREIMSLDLQAALPYTKATQVEIFLSYLGNFVCYQLTGQWLYAKPLVTKLGTGTMPERSALRLEPELLDVLYRMVPAVREDRPLWPDVLRDLRSCLRGSA